jgi:hypothetical protein
MKMLTKDRAEILINKVVKGITIPLYYFDYKVRKGQYIGSGWREPDEWEYHENSNDINKAMTDIVGVLGRLLARHFDNIADVELHNAIDSFINKKFCQVFDLVASLKRELDFDFLIYESAEDIIDAIWRSASNLKHRLKAFKKFKKPINNCIINKKAI